MHEFGLFLAFIVDFFWPRSFAGRPWLIEVHTVQGPLGPLLFGRSGPWQEGDHLPPTFPLPLSLRLFNRWQLSLDQPPSRKKL